MVIKNQKKILSIILVVVIIVVLVLVYFYQRGKKPIDNQMLVSTMGIDLGIVTGQELNISESGKDLLKTLKVLESVNLDTKFFEQEVFHGLVDYSQELPFEEKGRLNPFRPIGI